MRGIQHVVVLVALAAAYAAAQAIAQNDAFALADEDHDGVLQRREFVKWSNKIRDAISPLLASDDSAVAPPFVTNERVKYDPTDDVNSGAKRVKSSVNKFWSGFISGIVTIWATEVGDKTFFIAAILSMKHDRIVVFAGAISALIVMTVLSVVLGGVAALLLPPWMTHYAGACLFVLFGVKMLYDSREMNANGPSDELTEVEEELEGKKTAEDAGDAEKGIAQPAAALAVPTTAFQVFSQGFLLTFLAEWGDRSQIATITLSASNDAFGGMDTV
ncbi:hypothetical protein, variant [Aphanomyces invadans]|uniref:GDT1 family protein n=1 Tax=Aphanomyces invadans TaxID=157072 RepID=A0A024TMI3_9STRA|nr:hypothetical protein, variant [Aphanomyces invadans]ETV95214.1 hypothetical protein, variant [Aphanomyces invadans]|eukprot:XP_008875915.1 hypothetical protein, variant [Aphanomyces invadans]